MINTKIEIMRSLIELINEGKEMQKGELLYELEQFVVTELSVLHSHRAGIRSYYKNGDKEQVQLNLQNSWDKKEDFPYNTEQPVMGFELELEASKPTAYALEVEELATKVMSRSDDVVCQRDGSLKQGFEVVSQPATYEYYANHFDWGWMKPVIKSNFITNGIGEQGFHIHINRASFVDEEHTKRFAQAIVNDVKMFARIPLFTFFATPTAYCKAIVSQEERYCAVSIVNVNTIEVRCFLPVLDMNQILIYMKYMLNMQMETKETGETK